MDDLRGKTVLLTGASAGLGPHIARRLHRAGAAFVLSARNEESLQRLAKELGESKVIVADLSRVGEAERLAKEAGIVDVLVSNAGIPASGRLATFTVEELDRAIAVNLRAGIVLANALAPAMVERKAGHIVFMSSVAGKVPGAGVSVYCATKFGLRGFALALREELWGTGVGVSVVCPSFVTEAGMLAETGIKLSAAARAVGGEVSPTQVADAVWRAIARNRGEIDVAPFQLKVGLKLMALAPGFFMSMARSTVTVPIDEMAERQKHKR